MSLERASCRECGFEFEFEPAFWIDRGLSFPRRCPRCREARRAQHITGTVAYVNARGFGFIRGADGIRYYYDSYDFGADGPRILSEGMAVSFTPTPSAPNPRARRVRVLESQTEERPQ